MAGSKIRFRSALACEDLREDSDGKLIAVGILSPVLNVTAPKQRSVDELPPLKFHFLLVVDFLEVGEMELKFRLKRARAVFGSRTQIDIRVTALQKQVPFAVAPLTLKPRPGDEGFLLQHPDDDRWTTIAGGALENPLEMEGGWHPLPPPPTSTPTIMPRRSDATFRPR